MLANGASLNLCRYSDEPFNTNEIIWPHWGMIPSSADRDIGCGRVCRDRRCGLGRMA